MRAYCGLRPAPVYRREVVIAGLRDAGYDVYTQMIPNPGPDDVAVIWNRYSSFDRHAKVFERGGGRVLVMENGYLGKELAGDSWYAMALGHHAGRGQWPHSTKPLEYWLDASANHPGRRWDDLGVQLEPWRMPGGETLVLQQRGIGEPGIASPRQWAERLMPKLKRARMRVHPGAGRGSDLRCDLKKVSEVITWASGAALKCLVHGVPVWYEMQGWIGAWSARPLAERHKGASAVPELGDAARLATFRRLAWAQWRLSEIGDGTAFRALLTSEHL